MNSRNLNYQTLYMNVFFCYNFDMTTVKGTEQARGKHKLLNMTLLITTALVGISTLIIILGSIFLGMWLDKQFLTRPAFTLGLVLASIPVSLIVMIVIVKALINRFKRMTESIDQEYQ
jgi:hypothetical protein